MEGEGRGGRVEGRDGGAKALEVQKGDTVEVQRGKWGVQRREYPLVAEGDTGDTHESQRELYILNQWLAPVLPNTKS